MKIIIAGGSGQIGTMRARAYHAEGHEVIVLSRELATAPWRIVAWDGWGARLGLPAAQWMLELGAIFMRTETELILKSRRVVPGRLLANGFEF